MKELSGVALMRHNQQKYGTPLKTQFQNGLLAFLFLPIMVVTCWIGETNVLTALLFMGGAIYFLMDTLHKREKTPLIRLEGPHEDK